MGGRYLISGSQLGSLIALCRTDAKTCNNLLNEITEKQMIFNSQTTLESDINLLRFLEGGM